MSIKFDETADSRASTERPLSVTYKYVLAGIFDHLTARAYAIAATPALVAVPATVAGGSGILYRSDVKLDPAGYNLWRVTVPYVPRDNERRTPEAYEYKWSFDTTGGSAKVTQAKEHIQSYAPPGKTPPAHQGAIGVTENGVEGTEIVVPQFRWTETHQLPAVAATFAYSDLVEAITGRVNAATFRGKPAKSVRFDGAQGGGSSRNPDLVEITYHFTRGVAVSNLTAGDITGIDKDAWEYLWFEYETAEDAAAGRKIQKPIAAHVERVLDPADFSLLGIGTT